MKKQETAIQQFSFRKKKITSRPVPANKEDIIIIPMFSEFGCETLGVLYCIPELLKTRWAGKYIIVLSWYGREYFYRELADEIWELNEEHQWLRKYCKAFHHESKNLKRFEKEVSQFGKLATSGDISNVSVFPALSACPYCKSAIINSQEKQKCVGCTREYSPIGFFYDLANARKKARWLKFPSQESIESVKDFIPENPVAITARMRDTYGRNLSKDFYCNLIIELENRGYNPVWVGEKTSIMPCPYKRIPDFSSSSLSSDLEKTLALISQMQFTFQAFTASTRLSSLVGTPYIIIESPDQMWGVGQEGLRMNLLSKNNKRKLIVCQFLSARDNPDKLIDLVCRGVKEIEESDYSDIIGLVDNYKQVENLKRKNYERIGDFLRCENE